MENGTKPRSRSIRITNGISTPSLEERSAKAQELTYSTAVKFLSEGGTITNRGNILQSMKGFIPKREYLYHISPDSAQNLYYWYNSGQIQFGIAGSDNKITGHTLLYATAGLSNIKHRSLDIQINRIENSRSRAAGTLLKIAEEIGLGHM